MKHLFRFCIFFGMIFILYACKSYDTTEQINTLLEEAVEKEMTFSEQQEKIYALEKADEEIYEEIIELGSEELEKVRSLANEAIQLLDERSELKREEKASIEASKETFSQIEPLLEGVGDEETKAHLEKMYKTMQNRYDAYMEAFDAYVESLRLTKQLYEKFKEQDFTETNVYTFLNTVNESYDQVESANDTFNMQTSLYNELKEEYYEMLQQ